jgi:peptidoglycan hydrolase-like protein with peptidoglycan-binding domain
MDLAALFRAEGIDVVEHGNWRARVRPGRFAPVGIMVHHTAAKGSDRGILDVLTNGRADLIGPLCTAMPAEDGRLHLISAGIANHAGFGSSVVLDEVKRDVAPRGRASSRGLRDNVVGNALFYGFEVDNDGVGQPYPPQQIATVVKASAALCRYHSWSANRVIHHGEWTRRKTDMSFTGDIRALVTQYLQRGGLPLAIAAQAAPPPVPPSHLYPPFPLPDGWYFGPRSGPRESVSGYYSHRDDLRAWQARMAQRGWRIAADGLYGDQTASVARAFQAEKGLAVDGLVGKQTWVAAFVAPLTGEVAQWDGSVRRTSPTSPSEP